MDDDYIMSSINVASLVVFTSFGFYSVVRITSNEYCGHEDTREKVTIITGIKR